MTRPLRIAICTFAFALDEALVSMVESAVSARHDVVFYLSLHSQRPRVVAACEMIRHRRRNTRYFPYGYNRGLARSLNDAMLAAWEEGADVVINCNDDAVWGEGDVDRLAEAAMDRPECYAVAASGWHSGRAEKDSMGYCVMAFNPLAMEVVGCFDENFFPAYFEDVDHHRRARLAGLPDAVCDETGCYHAGSASILSDQALRIENDHAFVLNQLYWQRKWGPANEFSTPHNLGGSLRIAPADRRAPYGPGRDRSDLIAEPLQSEQGV